MLTSSCGPCMPLNNSVPQRQHPRLLVGRPQATGASYIIMGVVHVGGETGGLQMHDLKSSVEISPTRVQLGAWD